MDSQRLLMIGSVRAFLFDGSALAHLREVAEKHNLPADRAREFIELCTALLNGQIVLADMPGLVAQAFAVDEANAKQIAADVVGYRLLPLEKFIPGIPEQLQAWGADPAGYPSFRVDKEMIAAFPWARRLTEAKGIPFTDVLMKRLAFLLEQRWNGSKDAEALRTYFGRALTIGGLGMVKSDIDALSAAIEDELPYVEIISLPEWEEKLRKEEEEANAVVTIDNGEELEEGQEEESGQELSDSLEDGEAPLVTLPEIMPEHALSADVPLTAHPAAPVPVQTPPALVAPSVPVVAVPVAASATPKIAISLEDIPAVPVEAAKKAAALKKDALPMDDAYISAVAEIMKRAESLLASQQLSNEVFRGIAEKALRGLRDTYGVRDDLEIKLKAQGNAIAGLLDAVVRGVETYALLSGENRKFTPPASVPDVAAAEAKLLNDRFATMTHAPSGFVAPVLPHAQVSAARTKTEEIALQQKFIDPVAVTASEAASKPAPAKAALSVGSIPPSSTARKLTDIAPASRPVGPIEQLRGMGTVEFRRLSSNPDEAVKKIEDMLEALAAHAYDDRVAGITAWRGSPIMQAYVTMTREALMAGISVPEAAAQRRAKGQEALSPAEVKAIAVLNGKLRF